MPNQAETGFIGPMPEQGLLDKTNQVFTAGVSTVEDFVNKKAPSLLPSEINEPGGPVVATTPKEFNVPKNFKWTLSNVDAFLDEIPYIQLEEFKCNESVIKRQLDAYTRTITDTKNNFLNLFSSRNKNTIAKADDVYKEIWPTSDKNSTKYLYKFPYFNNVAFSLATPEWKSLDSLGDSLQQLASSVLPESVSGVVTKAMNVVDKASQLAMLAQYPSVGVVDRPRIFSAHNNRTIDINFPLFNTHSVNDWKANRNFIYTFMHQNLFYKRDFVTGIPPVYYKVTVPGTYFCYAACVTNFTVKNLGNIRKIDKDVVPDAYQIEIQLTEMVMPSQNQFMEAKSKNGAPQFWGNSNNVTQILRS